MASAADYGHAPPTEQESLHALGELIGPATAREVWTAIARTLGGPVETPNDVRQMAEQLMQVGDLMRVAGRSMKIRVITYEALNRVTP